MSGDEFIQDASSPDDEFLISDEDDAYNKEAGTTGPKYREHIFYVPPGKIKERIDIFLTRHIANATRSRVQKLIEGKGVTVNGVVIQKPGRLVVPDDHIVCTIPRESAPELKGEDIPIEIVYEDEAIMIVNKPAGMVVHPAHGNYHGTLVNALIHYSERLSQVRASSSPGILHRIDKETSGLLVVAKTNEAHNYIASQFMKHTIEREYWAIVWGEFKDSTGVIEQPVGRSKSDRKKMDVIATGKYAYTTYSVLGDYGFMSLVKLKLRTGRTHQIRVHMTHLHHPIFGDPTYGGRRIMYGNITAHYKSFIGNLLNILPRQALHAKTLGFKHPLSHEYVSFDSNIPLDMQTVLNKLKAYTKNTSETSETAQ